MPNTSALSPILPNFSATKNGQNGQASSDVKTNTNFNQILKNEVASKVKKTPTNTSKPPVNSQTTPTTASQNKTTAGKEADSVDKNISTEDKQSDEQDVAALAVPDETTNLLSFVDNVNALAYLNQNDKAKVDANSVEDGSSDSMAVKSMAIAQADGSNKDIVNYAKPPEIAKPNSSQTDQNMQVSDQPSKADVGSIKQSSLTSDMTDAKASISPELVAGRADQAISTTSTLDKSSFSKTVEEIDTAATIKDENPLNLDKTIRGEQLSGLAVGEKNASNKLTASPPAANEKIDLLGSTQNNKTAKTKESAADERQIDLNVNERSASDKFSLELKGFAQEVRRDNIDEKNRDAREFKVAELPKTESIPSAPPVQATQATLETASVSAASNFIGPRIGSKAWDQAMGQKIVWMVAGGEQSAQLTLNPPDLGPVQVVLSISDNQVDASFVSSHLDVREAIEAAAPKLREMMDSAGISLAGFSVSAQSTPSGSGFSSEGNSRNNSAQRANTSSNQDTPAATQATSRQASNPQGLVDTFV